MRVIQLLIILLLPLSVFADDIFIDGSSSTSTETIEFQGQSSENVSSSDKARLYYDKEDDKVKVSENGGAYSNMVVVSDDLFVLNTGDSIPTGSLQVGGDIIVAGTLTYGTLNPSVTEADTLDTVTTRGSITANTLTTGSLTTTGTLTSGGLIVDTDTIYVDSGNHRVGIGTSSPSHALSFDTSFGQKLALYNDVGTGLGIQVNLMELIGYSTDLDWTFGTGTSGALSRVMTIEGTGNVGIGTTDPVSELEVVGTITGNTLTDGTLSITGGDLTTAGIGAFGTLNVSGAISGERFTNYTLKDSAYPNPTDATKISIFDGGAGVEWVKIDGSAIADDTTNYKTSDSGIKGTSVDNAIFRMDKTAGYDLSSTPILFLRFYVDDISNLEAMTIYYSNSNYGSYFYRDIDLSVGATLTRANLKTGWNDVALPVYIFSESGSPSWALVDKIRIAFTSESGQTVNITFDEMTAYPNQLDRGVVLISFDDGYVSTYTTARKILDEYRFPAMVFPVVNLIDSGGDYLTLAQIKDLQDINRWDIGSHSYDHSDLTTLTSAQIETNFLQVQNYFQSNGIKAIDIIAYPYGAYNDTVLEVTKKYYGLGRSYDDHSFGRYETFPFFNKYALRVADVDKDDSTATVEGWIDLAETNKGVLLLGFHDIVTSPSDSIQYSTTNFTTIVDYLATKNIDVLTYSEFTRKYYDKTELDPRYVNITGDTMTGQLQSTTLTDGTVEISNGQIINATSIASTVFEGALTGNATTATTAGAGDAAVDFFGAGVDAVTNVNTCTDLEGTLLSVTTGTLNAVEAQDLDAVLTIGDTADTESITLTAGTLTTATLAITTAGNVSGLKQNMRFNIFDPLAVQTLDAHVCLIPQTDALMNITNIEISLDATTNEIDADLIYADTFIGLANTVVVNALDTSSGVLSDSSITVGSVPPSKALIIIFNAAPHTDITQGSFDIEYNYD